MTCPRCHAEMPETESVCPECQIRLVRNVSGVMKTSAVMIAAGTERGFYRSVQEVPEPLRTQLIETTSSPNSGIIIIADKAGKEQLSQVLARREGTAIPANVAAAPAPEQEEPPPAANRISWLAWSGFLLVLVLCVVVFALFQMHW